jgi:hypothetical protein
LGEIEVALVAWKPVHQDDRRVRTRARSRKQQGVHSNAARRNHQLLVMRGMGRVARRVDRGTWRSSNCRRRQQQRQRAGERHAHEGLDRHLLPLRFATAVAIWSRPCPSPLDAARRQPYLAA